MSEELAEQSVEAEPEADLSQERDDRCVPIVREIMKELAEQEPLIMSDNKEELIASYQPIYEMFVKRALEEGVLANDLIYITQLLLSVVDNFRNVVMQSSQRNLDRANEKLWGSTMEGISLQRIDEVLKS